LGGLSPTSVAVTGDNVEWSYSLTVPAGQTVRLAHFTILNSTRAGAEAAVNALADLAGQATLGLSSAELQSLANFPANPPTRTEAGSTLTITINSSNGILSIVSNGGSYTLTSGSFEGGGITPGRVSISGNSATVTAAGLAAYDTIRIVEGAGIQG